MSDTTHGWISAGALLGALMLGALMLGGALPAAAGPAEAWDDRHMQSRFGGPASGRLEAPPIEGSNGFASSTVPERGSIGVREQWLPGSQHPWNGRVAGLSATADPRATRRPTGRSLERHTGTPGSWSRTGQTSSLRGSSVRRSTGGR